MKELPRLLFLFVVLIFQINGTTTITTVNCTDLKDESLDDIAMLPCVYLKSSHGYVLSPADNDRQWIEFVKNLEDIYVNVKMDQSSATEFNIEHLNEINNDEIIITNNPNLTLISIKQDYNNPMSVKKFIISGNPRLKHIKIQSTGGIFIGSIEISDNSELIDVDMDFSGIEDNPPASYGQIYIGNNPKMNAIYMKKLKNISMAGDFIIDGNVKLYDVDLPVLEEIQLQGDFIIARNSALKMFKPLRVEKIHIKRNFLITENQELSRVEFLKAEQLTVEKTMQITKNGLTRLLFSDLKSLAVSTLVIAQNLGLQTVTMPVNLLNSTNLIISGNRILRQEFLKDVGKLEMQGNKKKMYIQEPKECWFYEPITDLKDVDGCNVVVDNLLLAANKTETINTPIKEIRGNVDLGNMEEGQLDFLKDTKIGGYITSSRCGFKTLHGHPVRSCYKKDQCPSCATCNMWLIILATACGLLALILIVWLIYTVCCKNSRRSLLKRVPGDNASTARTITPINKENFNVEDYY